MEDFVVVVAAGSLRGDGTEGAASSGGAGGGADRGGRSVVHLPHRWTSEGVTVRIAFSGAHLLHLAVAGCVLNDLYREAARSGIALAGVRVSADGGFDAETWRSTGIAYAVELDCAAPVAEQEALLAAVDAVAEIPRAVRLGASVTRAPTRTGLEDTA